MSQVFEALRRMEKEQGELGKPPLRQGAEFAAEGSTALTGSGGAPATNVKAVPSPRLVAMCNPHGLGAEKFRGLVTRLENLRQHKKMKSLQITSSMVSEGKTLVATNLALTFALHARSRVLLLEGDLRRPSIAELLGLRGLRGLSHWWSEEGQNIAGYLYQLNQMPLWVVTAGTGLEDPSHLLQSSRLLGAFRCLSDWFEWIIVDSTPMLPIADANLWSRLVDGTLLVVREGVASRKALEKGLASLDNLNLIGTLLNASSEPDRAGYTARYYDLSPRRSIRGE